MWLRRDLAAAGGASATHAAVAGAASSHDGSAGGATGGVAHVVHRLHGVGGVVDAAVFRSCEGNRRSFDSGCASAQDDRFLGVGGGLRGDSLLGWGGVIVALRGVSG